MKNFSKKGFSLTELLIVMFIISALTSVVLVSYYSIRKKTINNKVYTELLEVSSDVGKCIRSSVSAEILAPAVGGQICNPSSGKTWPQLTEGGGAWVYANFSWCHVSTKAICNPYNGSNCGGSGQTGSFCFHLPISDLSKSITCTHNGCTKSGF